MSPLTTRTSKSNRWNRLFHLAWDEIKVRVRQELGKRWDVAQYRARIPLGAGGKCSAPPQAPGRFFFEPHDLPKLIAMWQQRLPREAEETIQRAEDICRHQFNLLGYEYLDYGPEIDWHLDIVHDKRAPRKPWFQIRYLDFREVGDVKVTWELNRHQHLVTLAKAHCLTQEPRFAAEVFNQWYNWREQNPYPIGINWASSLEVGFRGLSWLWVRHLLEGCPITPSHFQTDLLRGLEVSGRHIERYLSTYFSPNTHLLGEGVALFFIGTLCPQLRAARRWQLRGWQIVLQESERQVRADGMHFEQSTYYHVYALDFFLHARMLAAANEIPIPRAFDHALEKMLEMLCKLGQAGVPARLGDDDGGRVFDPRRNRTQHLLDPLSTGAGLFGRSDFQQTGNFCEETIWLLGLQGLTKLDNLSPAQPKPPSSGSQASGLYLMGEGKPCRQQVLIDAGPLGTGRGGHGHADALSLVLAVNGRPWLIDPGTYVYISADDERDAFRGTAAHNTLQVDGLSQAEPTEAFAWKSQPNVRVERWVEGEGFNLFLASHDGYGRLPQPVLHRRGVFHLKSKFWVVLDRAEGRGSHSLSLSWHLAPDCISVPQSTACTYFEANDQSSLALLAPEGHGWTREIGEGCWSPAYGKKEPATVLTFRKQTQLPAEFATLLFPSTDIRPEAGKLTKINTEPGNPGVSAYIYSTPKECHYIFFADQHRGRWEAGPWASDASFLYCCSSPQGDLHHFALCDATFVEKNTFPIFAARRPVTSCEWLGQRSTAQVFCSETDAIILLPGGRVPGQEVMVTRDAVVDCGQGAT